MSKEPEEFEVHLTSYVERDDDEPMSHNKKVFDWDILLGPDSPFIKQRPDLAEAARRLDGHEVRHIIIDNRLLPAENFDAYWATTTFLEAMRAVTLGRGREVDGLIDAAEAKIGGDRLNHARRLGTLTYGVAVGSLHATHYAEVEDFVSYLRTKEQAAAILSRIKRRKTPTNWYERLAAKWDVAKRGVDGTLELPVIPVTMKTMVESFGSKESRGLKD